MTTLTVAQALQLAFQHQQAGDLASAQDLYQRILAVEPDNADALHMLGVICYQSGRHAEALQLMQRSIELNQHCSHFHSNQGELLHTLGRLDEAIASLRRALELDPANAMAWNSLGICLARRQHYDRAVEAWRNALACDGQRAMFHNNLGAGLQLQWRIDQAIASLERAVQLDPTYAAAWSNLLTTLSYSPRTTPRELFERHLAFARCLAEPLTAAARPHANKPDPDRPLRIGYVSPDFHEHSVMYFLEPLLEAHDRDRFHIYCYSNSPLEDSVTARIRGHVRQFRRIVGLDDEHAADLIRSDQIDLLVDLAGHTHGGRLLLFARRPAPVQVSYLGYPCTTGLSAIDYRITDARADPPAMTEAFHSEQLVRLPEVFLCYRPSPQAPAVAPLPADTAGHITFGSFNNLAKVSDETVRTWSRLLHEVAGSRLVLKAQALAGEEARAGVSEAFRRQGIDPGRLVLLPRADRFVDHMQSYAQIDVALDTFPYNGTATTCEALWMGVPVVVLAGQAHLSRVGVSLLGAIGLDELIARGVDDYVRLAAGLAQDRRRLRALRTTLRDIMLRSPLLEAPRLTRHLESACRQMWQAWCRRQAASA